MLPAPPPRVRLAPLALVGTAWEPPPRLRAAAPPLPLPGARPRAV